MQPEPLFIVLTLLQEGKASEIYRNVKAKPGVYIGLGVTKKTESVREQEP